MKKFVLILSILLLICGCNDVTNHKDLNNNIGSVVDNNKDLLIVHYIDVHQGDASFIEFPNKEVMLIDAGEKEYGDVVKNYISNLGYKNIDYVIGTHPHSDHIGGLQKVIESFNVDKVYLPNVSNNTNTFIDLVKSIKDNSSLYEGKKGINIIDDDNLKVSIISPSVIDNDNLNNDSIVIKIVYDNNSFLFTGDIESDIEKEILDEVNVDVIKVSHHGSDTSSCYEFVNSVSSKYAIISVGKDNSYNHPVNEILYRWENSGSLVYRTDESGNIVVKSDGENIQVFEEEKVDIVLSDITEEVIKGDIGRISIVGKKNHEYSISVMYSSGKSNADGLENKTSDENGNVSWEWKVSKNVKPGTYKIIISDSKDNEKTFTFKVIE